jgi:predicted alpha/beta-hydrolase family hydrolase
MLERLQVEIGRGERVTALAYAAATRERGNLTLVLGHGAGAGQTSGFMVNFATQLAARGIDTLTFNFVYTEVGRRVPDPNNKLEACFRGVLRTLRSHDRFGGGRLMIGGKSMGGRIATQIAADADSDVAGLVVLGYPLHPPGKPEQLRMEHLSRIRARMLIVQGSRDAFGTPDELRPVIEKAGCRADLYVVEGGDHSFKVPKRSGLTQDQIYERIQIEIVKWLDATVTA